MRNPLLLTALFLLLRLPGLLALPLFNDEAVYLLRARVFPAGLIHESFAGATLPDGKLIQELFLAALARLPGDPLLPARLLSVACGLGTLLVIVACGRVLNRPMAGLLAAGLYALAPLAQIHDRLALPDSMLTLVSALLLWASLDYARRPQVGRREALLLGALVAVASMVKLSGLLFFGVPILAVLLLSPSRAEIRRRLALLRLALIVALACLAALAPFHYGGAERQKVGVAVSDRPALIGNNLATIGDWLLRYLPGPLLLPPLALLALGLTTAERTKNQELRTGVARPWFSVLGSRLLIRETAFLFAAGLSLPLIFAVISEAIYPRYILPAWPALLLAAGLACSELWSMVGSRNRVGRLLVALAPVAAALWGLYFAIAFINEPRNAPLAAADRAQYIERWTAGYNLEPILEAVRAEAAARPILLVQNDQARLLNLAAYIYLADPADTSRITMYNLELKQPDAPERLRAMAQQQPTYLLLDSQVISVYHINERFPNLRTVYAVDHPDGQASFLLLTQQP